MHSEPMKESEGTLKKPQHLLTPCRHCARSEVTVQEWHSNCGGYIDFKYTCGGCGKVWWVDGIDS